MTPKPRVAGTTMSEMSVSVTEVEPAGQSTLLHDPSQGMDHADRRSPPASPRAPPGRRPATAERRRVAVLARTLETQVIPRLVLSRREGNQPAYIDSHGGSVPQDEDVTTLAALSMAGDLTGSLDYIAALRARDMPLEIVYLHLLAPVGILLLPRGERGAISDRAAGRAAEWAGDRLLWGHPDLAVD